MAGKTWETALDGAVNKRTCQPEKPENSQAKTWGPASTLGVERAPPRSRLSNRRERAAANTCGMFRIRAGGGKGCCQAKRASKLVAETVGSPAWIRTTIHGSKGRCPTIRRPGIIWQTSAVSSSLSLALLHRNAAPPACACAPRFTPPPASPNIGKQHTLGGADGRSTLLTGYCCVRAGLRHSCPPSACLLQERSAGHAKSLPGLSPPWRGRAHVFPYLQQVRP